MRQSTIGAVGGRPEPALLEILGDVDEVVAGEVEVPAKRVEPRLRRPVADVGPVRPGDLLDPSNVRRWRARYEAGGRVALYDRRCVRPSRRKAPAPEVQRILGLYREHFAGWNVRHFYRFARRDHRVRLSYSFVKLALQEAGLVRKGRARGSSSEPALLHFIEAATLP